MGQYSESIVNVAKIIRRALLDANVVRVDGTTPRILAQPDLLSWVEEGTDILEKALRNARVDYMIVIRDSTDATFIWDGIQYNIANELNVVNSTTVYTLPPDCLRLRRIRATSVGEGRNWGRSRISRTCRASGRRPSATMRSPAAPGRWGQVCS